MGASGAAATGMNNYSATDEAKTVRASRQQMRRGQNDDPLRERVRIMNYWRSQSEINKAFLPYKGAWWFPFLTQPGFRWTLMPRLRVMLDAREKASRDRYAAEMRESSRRWQQIKAERASAKARAKAPQLELILAAPDGPAS
jgi:hypothetical protein